MLSVSFSLALVAAMLFGIVLPVNPKEVDEFNGPTPGPIPVSLVEMVRGCELFKGLSGSICRVLARPRTGLT